MVAGAPEAADVRALPFLAGHRSARATTFSTCSGGGPILSAFATIFRLIASSSASLVSRRSVPSSSDNRRRLDGAGPCPQNPSSRSAPRRRIEAWERRSRSLEPSPGVRGVKFAMSFPRFRIVCVFRLCAGADRDGPNLRDLSIDRPCHRGNQNSSNMKEFGVKFSAS